MSDITQELPRILTLRLERKNYPAQTAQRYITFKGDRYEFGDDFEEFLKSIPEIWNSDKDRLIYFALFTDKTFLCSRNKDVYNFSTKETETKTYRFDSVTTEQLDAFVSHITEYFTKAKLKKVENLFDTIVSSLYDMSYLKYSLLELRYKELSNSDYMFNSDYKFKTIEDEENWRKYREEWRNITEQEAWKNSDYINVSIPVSPKPKDQFMEMTDIIGESLRNIDVPGNVYDEISEQFNNGFAYLIKNYSNIVLKVEILKKIASMNLPLGFNASDMVSFESLIPNSLFPSLDTLSDIRERVNETNSVFDIYLYEVNEKIKLLNEKMSEFNLGFSMGDIIEKYLEDLKEKFTKRDEDENISQYLYDMFVEGNEGDAS